MKINVFWLCSGLILIVFFPVINPIADAADEKSLFIPDCNQPGLFAAVFQQRSSNDGDEEFSGTETGQPGPKRVPTTARRYVAHGLLAAGFLGYMTYGYYVFWDDIEYQKFYISDWNDTYQRSYAGGSDKISHAFGGYLITRTLSQVYAWSGMQKKKAAWLGFWVSQTFLLLGELEDGFTLVYGFDPVDFAANLGGGAIGVLEELYPLFDDCFDFRISYWPSHEYRQRENFENIAEDYSGQEFYFIGKIPDYMLTNNTRWLSYLELYTGFRSRGYMPGYRHAIEHNRPDYIHFYKERELLIGLSLNVRKVLDAIFPNNDEKPVGTARSLVNYFFEFYQHPLKLGSDITLSQYSWSYPEPEE